MHSLTQYVPSPVFIFCLWTKVEPLRMCVQGTKPLLAGHVCVCVYVPIYSADKKKRLNLRPHELFRFGDKSKKWKRQVCEYFFLFGWLVQANWCNSVAILFHRPLLRCHSNPCNIIPYSHVQGTYAGVARNTCAKR